jgi:hypothetical protein
MKIFLLLIYLMAGDLKVERTEVKDLDECITRGNARVERLVKDPTFVRGVFADCIEVEERRI